MSKPGTALALLANRLQVSEAEVKQSLTQTVFKGASDAQMTALLVVANEYGLNPFVKELFAFPSQNGIVPMVSIDGWLRIINDHPQFAGMDIVYAETITQIDKARPCPEYIEVTIHRKDRPHVSSPIREYLDECYRNTQPWNTMTRRMLRHKAIKEAARVTMGLHGIYDEDEAADILAREGKRIVATGEVYEVVAEDVADTGEIIGPQDHEALLAEMERTGLSQAAVAKNLEHKANYTGPLEDMPVRVYEPLMAGLRSMKSKAPQPAPEPTAEEPNDAAETSPADDVEPQGDEEPREAAPAPESADCEPPVSQGQLRQLGIVWRKLADIGYSEEELRDLLQQHTGLRSRKILSFEQAHVAITRFSAELEKHEGETA